MKKKYITTQVLLASRSGQATVQKDIHAQLEETLAERKKIMQGLEDFSRKAHVIDMYLTKAA